MLRRVLALLSALLLLALPVRAELVDPDDAIPADWIVIDADLTYGKRYIHPASFAAPEGYVYADYTKYNDGVSRDAYLTAADPAAPVELLYVDAVAGMTAAEYTAQLTQWLPMALGIGVSARADEPFTATVAAHEASCVYIHYSTLQGDYGCLYVVIDAGEACITAVLSGRYTTPENVQTAEQLLAGAEILLAGLTVIE